MCASVTGGPTASRKTLSLPGDITVSVDMSTPSQTTVKATCKPGGGLKGGGSSSKTFSDFATISIPVHLEASDGHGVGPHVLTVELEEKGCAKTIKTVAIAVTSG
jgi:hypothetical protein